MASRIVNNRVEGSRITVWDITHYLENGRSHEYIAEVLPITLEQVQAAVKYIEEHREEVMRVHVEIEARIARGNSPEIEKLREASHRRFQERLQARIAARGLSR